MTRRTFSLLIVVGSVIGACGSSEPSDTQSLPSVTAEPISTTPLPDPTTTTGLTMPADWPTAVPVVGGGIAVSTASGTGQQKTWVVEFFSNDLAATWTTAQQQLTDAGFTQDSSSTAADGTIDAVFSGNGYMVMVKIYHEVDTDEDEIRYVVSQRP